MKGRPPAQMMRLSNALTAAKRDKAVRDEDVTQQRIENAALQASLCDAKAAVKARSERLSDLQGQLVAACTALTAAGLEVPGSGSSSGGFASKSLLQVRRYLDIYVQLSFDCTLHTYVCG